MGFLPAPAIPPRPPPRPMRRVTVECRPCGAPVQAHESRCSYCGTEPPVVLTSGSLVSLGLLTYNEARRLELMLRTQT